MPSAGRVELIEPPENVVILHTAGVVAEEKVDVIVVAVRDDKVSVQGHWEMGKKYKTLELILMFFFSRKIQLTRQLTAQLVDVGRIGEVVILAGHEDHVAIGDGRQVVGRCL